MRLLAVVGSYAQLPDRPASLWCRELFTRLAGRGHRVEVLAGDARQDGPPAATEQVDGVAVHRVQLVGVGHAGLICRQLAAGPQPAPLRRQEAWMTARAGSVAGVQTRLAQTAAGYDVVTFFDYEAPITWAGLPACAGRVATVLHPMATRGTLLGLSLFDTTLRLPTALAFVDDDEEALVARRLGRRRVGAVVGIGVDTGRAEAGVDNRGAAESARSWESVVSRYERLLWVVQARR